MYANALSFGDSIDKTVFPSLLYNYRKHASLKLESYVTLYESYAN